MTEAIATAKSPAPEATIAAPRANLTGPQLVETARSLARSFAATAAQRESERRLLHDEMREVSRAGLLGARVPASFGGPGASLLDVARIFFELAKADPNIAQALQPHFGMVDLVRTYGTPAQQKKFLGEMRDGALFASASAERGGPFIGHIATTVRTEGAGLRLRGRKFYGTGSPYADYLHVSANLEADGQRVFVIVPRGRAGVQLADDWRGMGQRLTGSGTVLLDDVEIFDDEILVIKEWTTRRNNFGSFAQLRHAAIDAGIAAAALDDACRAAKELGRPLPEAGVANQHDDPYVLHAVGEFALHVNISIAMVERAARLLDIASDALFAGRDADALLVEGSIAAAEARAATDTAALRVSEGLYRVAGASATDTAHNFDRHWRNARTHTTHDPIAYKYRLTGDYYLNGRKPPISPKF